jgi:hypothetical protein
MKSRNFLCFYISLFELFLARLFPQIKIKTIQKEKIRYFGVHFYFYKTKKMRK